MQGDGHKKLSDRERRMRALKIGAAAAGGGALLAITGAGGISFLLSLSIILHAAFPVTLPMKML